MDQGAPAGHDPVLLPFLQTADPADAERLLADLVHVRAAATIRGVVRRTLQVHAPPGASWLGEDAEDVAGNAILRLIAWLQALRDGRAREQVQHFDAYVARIAAHVCYEHVRRRHPARARLRNQIWYVMTRHPHLRLARGRDDRWMCSLDDGGRQLAGVPSAKKPRRPALPDIVRELLADGPAEVDLNDLVDRVGRRLGILPPPGAHRADALGSAPERLPDRANPTPAAAFEQVEFVRTLWREVQSLPLRQRTALLLNLRDAHGGDALDLLPITGTASLRQIALALDMPPEELARLWPELPLDDHAIAARLRITRQQVINLRKAARARLSRRLRPVAHEARPVRDTRADVPETGL